jgi:hypothetical protein
MQIQYNGTLAMSHMVILEKKKQMKGDETLNALIVPSFS